MAEMTSTVRLIESPILAASLVASVFSSVQVQNERGRLVQELDGYARNSAAWFDGGSNPVSYPIHRRSGAGACQCSESVPLPVGTAASRL